MMGFTQIPIYEFVDISPGVKGQNITFTALIPCIGEVKTVEQ
jgi:hypothetical protein